MVYTEDSRLTHYTGGIQLSRPGLQVKSQELRAFLAEAGADSRVEKAYADGAVEIFSTGKDRTRNGTGEHAEYYTDGSESDPARTLGDDGGKDRSPMPQPNTTEGTEVDLLRQR